MYRGKHNKDGAPASRRRLRRPLLAAAAVVLILGAAIGGTVAYLVTSQTSITNTFTPAKVDVTIEETVSNHQKTSITIQNTGNVEAYIRVMLVGNTVDGTGKVTGSFAPEFMSGTDWVKIGDYYYYKKTVSAKGETTNLLASGSGITLKENQTVTVLAQAIQSKPDTVVQQTWGVTIADGNVTAYTATTGGAAG